MSEQSNYLLKKYLNFFLFIIFAHSAVTVLWNCLSILLVQVIEYPQLPWLKIPLLLIAGGWVIKKRGQLNWNLFFLAISSILLLGLAQFEHVWGYRPWICGNSYLDGIEDPTLDNYQINLFWVEQVKVGLVMIILLILSWKYRNVKN